jgi:hypothetical protein
MERMISWSSISRVTTEERELQFMVWAETGIREIADPSRHISSTIAAVHRNESFFLKKLLNCEKTGRPPDQGTVSIVDVVRRRHLSSRDRGFPAEWVLSKQTMISGHSASYL